MVLTLSDVISAIYECEENCSLSGEWDDGWRVTIGGSQHTVWEAEMHVDDPVQAAKWLHEQAIERCPDYKERYGNCVLRARPPRTSLPEAKVPRRSGDASVRQQLRSARSCATARR
jgi:hypothetical protein